MMTRSRSVPCHPLWATPRNPERATWGPKIAGISAKLGKPFMPHQRMIMDVAGEVDPETLGLWYREVVIGLPRQSGKSTLLLPKFVWRAEAAHLLGGRQRMLYAAQTKTEALEKFEEDYVEDLAAARVMRGRYRVQNPQGRKRIRFRSGSTLMPVATGTTRGHGRTLDDGSLDEAWAQTDNRVEAAWRPAMITRPSPQLWAMSTAGKTAAESPYWRAKVLRGRALVRKADPRSRVAYFEYGMPEGMDPQDPATWWAIMPALGFMITEDAIRHELETIEGGLPEFLRAYCNVWPDEFDDEEWVLPELSWGNCLDTESRRADSSPPAVAVDTTPDRGHSAVSFSADRPDGLPMVQVVRHGAGTTWVPEHVAELARAKGATVVVVDGASPAHNLVNDIRGELRDVCDVWETTAGEMADACSDIYDGVVTEQLRHRGQAELDLAVAGAKWRDMVGGRRAFDRRTSASDISPLVSATLALAGHDKHPGRHQILY